ncbi:seizure protein 6 homolog isoform X1 [Lethenteron reissneri]|uniref:seizure protein 6 homolog isoform X1 n=1 Tax=Lethenteron reissneri TaxID=7753 RepID=UPI002AB67C6C|nr:seizure protein 6 homolog isoform X1 [Lethenteron reissneri]
MPSRGYGSLTTVLLLLLLGCVAVLGAHGASDGGDEPIPTASSSTSPATSATEDDEASVLTVTSVTSSQTVQPSSGTQRMQPGLPAIASGSALSDLVHRSLLKKDFLGREPFFSQQNAGRLVASLESAKREGGRFTNPRDPESADKPAGEQHGRDDDDNDNNNRRDDGHGSDDGNDKEALAAAMATTVLTTTVTTPTQQTKLQISNSGQTAAAPAVATAVAVASAAAGTTYGTTTEVLTTARSAGAAGPVARHGGGGVIPAHTTAKRQDATWATRAPAQPTLPTEPPGDYAATHARTRLVTAADPTGTTRDAVGKALADEERRGPEEPERGDDVTPPGDGATRSGSLAALSAAATTGAAAIATNEGGDGKAAPTAAVGVEERPTETSPVAEAVLPEMDKDESLGVATEAVGRPEVTATVAAATAAAAAAEEEEEDDALSSDVHPDSDAATSAVTDADEETTTTTIITTTIITTVQTPVPCNMNYTGPDGYIDSPDSPGFPYFSSLDCTYTVTVYTGYGVELQVKTLNLVEGEVLSIYSILDGRPLVLANQTLLVEGQVIRSPTNQVSVHFQSFQIGVPGSFRFHYQEYVLSCPVPGKPAFGEVYVSGLHPGGKAYFHCKAGYQLRGQSILTCVNSTHPGWDATEPLCLAMCGGLIRNASVGRILSPNFPANYTNNLTCVWLIEAPDGQRLHLHFEKLALAEDDDRLIVRNGNTSSAVPLYDSYETEYFPGEGVISTSRYFRLELTTDNVGTAPGFAVRYEAFERGRCYEPYIQYGNYSSSDPLYSVGTLVEFACHPGYTLEQGTPVSECLDIREPYWNQTEPICRALCGGDVTGSHGIILSPNYPDIYDEGQDCIWGVRVREGRRILLEIQLLDIGSTDSVTIFDGDDLTSRALGQYAGTHHRFRVFTTGSEVTVQFLSDPAGPIPGRGRGFVVHYSEVVRNDTCSPLPDVTHGWKTLSHAEPIRGTVATYQCEPGYDILGTDILMCQWDLSWSTDPPSCQRVQYCSDPGVTEHGRRVLSDSRFLVSSTVQYGCDRGYQMEGGSLLTCHARDTGSPKWSAPAPRCVPEVFDPCVNPGMPENGYQLLYKQLYQPGELLRFSCLDGFQLVGDVSVRCLPGHPSRWSGSAPKCQVAYTEHHTDPKSEVAKTSESGVQKPGRDIVVAITIPVVIVGLLIGGIYVYFTKLRGKSSLRVPLTSSHSYARLPDEAVFDNPIYEIGEASKRLPLSFVHL